MVEPHASELEQAAAHYRTAGNGLCLLGGINCLVAVIALASGSQNTFIAYDTMALFSVSFIAVGLWMRKQGPESA